ncbi:uncharacterized protein LOC143464524 [Clavelina lepadiformis]|uniref:uncharacterized protein LOC143464524 n=1 Tax=Clavelina lepadiformis TaxID=159417 RepID=UPI0040434332
MKIISLCGVLVLMCCGVDAQFGFPGIFKFTCKRPSNPANGKFTPSKSKYNIGRSITYSCNTGFKLSSPKSKRTCVINTFVPGPPSCVDINECENNPCHSDATCTNTKGSFRCRCKTGYSGNGKFCADRDECRSRPCHPDANCRNTRGSFTCRCKSGYSGDGFRCRDVNECTRSPCDENADCTNIKGSFRCRCKDGFIGNGRECVRNSCASNPCHSDADCTNTDAGFQCECKAGYTGDGTTCTDVNECSSRPCHNRGATCTNSPGSYSCKCRNGYTGDGKQCSDINECQTQPCDANARCINTPGRYFCSCNLGYGGNGRTCTKLAECPTPDLDIANGRVSDNRFGTYYEGNVLRVICDVNYKLNEFVVLGSIGRFDRNSYQCGSDGEWAGEIPECIGSCLHACRRVPVFPPFPGAPPPRPTPTPTPPCGCLESCKDDESCCEDYDRYCNKLPFPGPQPPPGP